jgi:hypothetical protein
MTNDRVGLVDGWIATSDWLLAALASTRTRRRRMYDVVDGEQREGDKHREQATSDQ